MLQANALMLSTMAGIAAFYDDKFYCAYITAWHDRESEAKLSPYNAIMLTNAMLQEKALKQRFLKSRDPLARLNDEKDRARVSTDFLLANYKKFEVVIASVLYCTHKFQAKCSKKMLHAKSENSAWLVN